MGEARLLCEAGGQPTHLLTVFEGSRRYFCRSDVVVRGGAEPPTFRFSAVAAAHHAGRFRPAWRARCGWPAAVARHRCRQADHAFRADSSASAWQELERWHMLRPQG